MPTSNNGAGLKGEETGRGSTDDVRTMGSGTIVRAIAMSVFAQRDLADRMKMSMEVARAQKQDKAIEFLSEWQKAQATLEGLGRDLDILEKEYNTRMSSIDEMRKALVGPELYT